MTDFLSIFVTYNTGKLRKILLILALLLSGLTNAQVDSTSRSTNENSYYGRRYPVFPDDGSWPEKSSGVPVFILILFGISILTLAVLIIRKAKSKRSRIIIEGFAKVSEKGLGTRIVSIPFYIDSSSVYSKRRGSRGTQGRHKSTGGTSGIW